MEIKIKGVECQIEEDMLLTLTFDEFFEVLKIKNKNYYNVDEFIAVCNCLRQRIDLSDTQKEILRGLLPNNLWRLDLIRNNHESINEDHKLKLNKILLKNSKDLREFIDKNIHKPEFDRYIEKIDSIPRISLSVDTGKFSDLVKIVREEQQNPIIKIAKENLKFKKLIVEGEKIVFEHLKIKFTTRKFKSIDDDFIEYELESVVDLLKGKFKSSHILEILQISKSESISVFNDLCRGLLLGFEPDFKDNYMLLCKIYGLVKYKDWLDNFSKQGTRIYIDDIDSFREVKKVQPNSINQYLSKHGYINLDEDSIQKGIEQILGVPFHKQDWGGEENDLYTANLKIRDKRVATAFLLKGNGLKVNSMEIKHCGKNGNQILRLFDSPAELFIVQFVGNISEYVIKDVQSKINELKLKGKKVWYCIIDGQDTARLLKAYDKI
jgi:hypothetical protein